MSVGSVFGRKSDEYNQLPTLEPWFPIDVSSSREPTISSVHGQAATMRVILDR